jgi:hypothetical protein
MLAVTQISNAGTRRFWGFGSQQRPPSSSDCTPTTRRYNTERDLATSTRGQTETHVGDGAATNANAERAARERGRQRPRNCATPSTGTSGSSSSTTGPTAPSEPNDGDGGSGSDRVTIPPGGADGANNGLEVLGRDCANSERGLHDGFQNAPACAETSFGEVPAQELGATLLITEHPEQVGVNQPFEILVSTRNLQRDRFLGAGAGGYYLESSFLQEDGIVRGHFHTGCQLLQNDDEAPPADRANFFVATEDGGGSTAPDTVTVQVAGLAAPGLYKCASWAGDGSHRIPMMQFANQIPAIDSFRLVVQ